MIISRTPFRISFVGGGSDFEEFYSKYGGSVISTTINKYIYIIAKKNYTNKYIIRYSEKEIVDDINLIKHNIIRETIKSFDIKDYLEVVVISDIAASGSGLGSSSTLTVGVLNALSHYKHERLSTRQLAKMACELEIDILGSPIGKQDQYAVAFGGFNQINFKRNRIDVISLKELNISAMMNYHTLLFYLGYGRESNPILTEHKTNISNKYDILKKQAGLCEKVRESFVRKNGLPIDEINKSWEYKLAIAPKSSNYEIDKIIEKLHSVGNVGLKLCGAGGGGFMMVMCEMGLRNNIIEMAKSLGLQLIDYRFEYEGSKIIHADRNN